MANPRKPKGLKELEGTARPDRDYGEVELPEATSLDPPSSLVSPEAERVWAKVVSLLHPARVLSEADLMVLTHLCNLHARLMETWQAGETPTAALLAQSRYLFREFGLTPESRSRVSQVKSGQSDPSDKFFSGPKAVNE